MIPSNILNVFTQSETSASTDDNELCLPCQVMGSLTCLAGGLYFMSELPFKDSSPKAKPNPLWWKNSVKGAGLMLFGLGIYRGGEGWLWNTHLKYKDTKYI